MRAVILTHIDLNSLRDTRLSTNMYSVTEKNAKKNSKWANLPDLAQTLPFLQKLGFSDQDYLFEIENKQTFSKSIKWSNEND